MDVSSKRFVLVSAVIATNLLFTIQSSTLATPTDPAIPTQPKEVSLVDGAVVANTVLPQEAKKAVAESKIVTVVVTAYSSTPDQTDDTPFITASGTHVRSGIAASSFLPFGAKVKLPKAFGDKIFVIEDAMNSRYKGQNRIDVWFESYEEARAFGVRTVKAEIL